MSNHIAAGERTVGTLRAADGKGIVRLEDLFDTDIDDLWSALTDPRRLARWLGEVEGDLRQGGEFRAHYFASGWEGTGRVEVCEPPQRLMILTSSPDEPDGVIEATLTVDRDETVLVIEDRGGPWSESRRTGQETRSTSRISPPISPGVNAATRGRGGRLHPTYRQLAVDIT